MPAAPARLLRSQSFFGIHFDFHCKTTDRLVGRRVTPAMVRSVIKALKPDYIQIDCKGHPGVVSYPSKLKISTRAASYVGDPLKTWRSETAKAGVALFMHYSGVWDAAALAKHPEWAARDAHNKPHERSTSVFSPYVDQLMLPQLLELATTYKVDGAWVDGDCWSAVLDYSKWAKAAWKKATGKSRLPRSEKEKDFPQFVEFCRQGFRNYVRHYTSTLHEKIPGFQVASNWAFSSHMPEFPSLGIDFLSGDFWPNDSLNSARFEARILASQRMPWDLMSWGFATRAADRFRHRTPKSSIQLQQEAALVLALGGGYQCYFNQNRDASIRQHDLNLYAPVAKFCRDRQSLCSNSRSASQIAILYSTSAFYAGATNLFTPWNGVADPYRGILSALVESSLSVDSIHDGHLLESAPTLDAYRLIVVPEWQFLAPSAEAALLDFTRRGGSVLLIGPHTTRLFSRELALSFPKNLTPDCSRFWAPDSRKTPHILAGLYGNFPRKILARPGTQLLGKLYEEAHHAGPSAPAAALRKFGKGNLAALFPPVGSRYFTGRDVNIRLALLSLIQRLLPNPLLSVTTTDSLDVSLRARDNQLLVHLCNTNGPHASDFAWNSIPPTSPVSLQLRLPTNPASVTWQPLGTPLPWKREKDLIHIVVPRVDIHGAVVIS